MLNFSLVTITVPHLCHTFLFNIWHLWFSSRLIWPDKHFFNSWRLFPNESQQLTGRLQIVRKKSMSLIHTAIRVPTSEFVTFHLLEKWWARVYLGETFSCRIYFLHKALTTISLKNEVELNLFRMEKLVRTLMVQMKMFIIPFQVE